LSSVVYRIEDSRVFNCLQNTVYTNFIIKLMTVCYNKMAEFLAANIHKNKRKTHCSSSVTTL